MKTSQNIMGKIFVTYQIPKLNCIGKMLNMPRYYTTLLSMMFYLMMNRTIIEEWVFSGILIAGHKPHGAGCPAGESGDDSDDI